MPRFLPFLVAAAFLYPHAAAAQFSEWTVLIPPAWKPIDERYDVALGCPAISGRYSKTPEVVELRNGTYSESISGKPYAYIDLFVTYRDTIKQSRITTPLDPPLEQAQHYISLTQNAADNFVLEVPAGKGERLFRNTLSTVHKDFECFGKYLALAETSFRGGGDGTRVNRRVVRLMTVGLDRALLALEAKGPSDWTSLNDPRVTTVFYKFRRVE
jgi:hypothetical protein